MISWGFFLYRRKIRGFQKKMAVQIIDSFRGSFYFLSNFYKAPIMYDAIIYATAEAAFQAQKTNNIVERAYMSEMGPAEAKRYGRKVKLRKDWNDVRLSVMKDIVYAKFSQNPDLKEKLLATGKARLEEGNDWGDRFWGTVGGSGENHLGKILMEVREEFQNESRPLKELVILEREDGWYDGYEHTENGYKLQFSAGPVSLFVQIKNYTDRGYKLKCFHASEMDNFQKHCKLEK